MYAGGILVNAGNYKSFGDTKIIPGVSLDLFHSLISNAKFDGMGYEQATAKWNAVKNRVYSLTEREKQLGLGSKVTLKKVPCVRSSHSNFNWNYSRELPLIFRPIALKMTLTLSTAL